jgi:hypothetical protein
VGFEQQLGSKLTLQENTSGSSRRCYDFNSILNTPLNFPIQFQKSKIDGALVRVTLNNVHGFSAFSVMGHSDPGCSVEIGGINFGTAYAPVARQTTIKHSSRPRICSTNSRESISEALAWTDLAVRQRARGCQCS